MPYTQLQFIGYAIDTSPRDNGDGTETYLGLANPQQDIEARCQLMQRAIDTARNNLPQVSPPPAPGTVLNVFLAPEFYFRGDQGAYQMDDVQFAIAMLQRLAADDQWDDWVFAFGTIVGTSSPHLPSPPYEIDHDAIKDVYNFVLIQEGGVLSQGSAGARVVMKELKSDIDFIADVAFPGGLLLGEVDPMNAGPSGPGREQQQVAYDGAGIFALRGMTWAADICLDHLEGRLMNSPQLPGENEVQVQLIPSAGADIDADQVVAEAGGFAFNVDGANGSHADLQQVGPPLAPVAQLAAYPVPDGDITLNTVSPPLVVEVDELYRYDAGEVVIFGLQDVPAPQVVQGSVAPALIWPANADYQFEFTLIYDEDDDFTTLLVKITSRKTNFHGNKYFLPLQLSTLDADKLKVSIQMRLTGGTGGFDHAVWCKIDVPGFDFQGNAFQFNDHLTDLPPETVW